MGEGQDGIVSSALPSEKGSMACRFNEDMFFSFFKHRYYYYYYYYYFPRTLWGLGSGMFQAAYRAPGKVPDCR